MQQHQTLSEIIWDKVDGAMDIMEEILPLYLWFIAALALAGVATFMCIITLLAEIVIGNG